MQKIEFKFVPGETVYFIENDKLRKGEVLIVHTVQKAEISPSIKYTIKYKDSGAGIGNIILHETLVFSTIEEVFEKLKKDLFNNA